jgi:hypothetical protein
MGIAGSEGEAGWIAERIDGGIDFRAPRTMTIFRRIDRRRGAPMILAHSLS